MIFYLETRDNKALALDPVVQRFLGRKHAMLSLNIRNYPNYYVEGKDTNHLSKIENYSLISIHLHFWITQD